MKAKTISFAEVVSILETTRYTFTNPNGKSPVLAFPDGRIAASLVAYIKERAQEHISGFYGEDGKDMLTPEGNPDFDCFDQWDLGELCIPTLLVHLEDGRLIILDVDGEYHQLILLIEG